MTLAMMEITQNSLAVNLTDGSALIYQALHLAKSLPFTDKLSIFIDVSVILPNAAPAQSSLQVLSQIYRQTILGYFHHGNGKRHAYEKTG